MHGNVVGLSEQRSEDAHDTQKMTIPTMTTAIKRKIRNQKQPL
jgi:hypothetical protein